MAFKLIDIVPNGEPIKGDAMPVDFIFTDDSGIQSSVPTVIPMPNFEQMKQMLEGMLQSYDTIDDVNAKLQKQDTDLTNSINGVIQSLTLYDKITDVNNAINDAKSQVLQILSNTAQTEDQNLQNAKQALQASISNLTNQLNSDDSDLQNKLDQQKQALQNSINNIANELPNYETVKDFNNAIQQLENAVAHEYLPITGGTLTGDLTISDASTDKGIIYGGKETLGVAGHGSHMSIQPRVRTDETGKVHYETVIYLEDDSGNGHSWVLDTLTNRFYDPNGKYYITSDDLTAALDNYYTAAQIDYKVIVVTDALKTAQSKLQSEIDEANNSVSEIKTVELPKYKTVVDAQKDYDTLDAKKQDKGDYATNDAVRAQIQQTLNTVNNTLQAYDQIADVQAKIAKAESDMQTAIQQSAAGESEALNDAKTVLTNTLSSLSTTVHNIQSQMLSDENTELGDKNYILGQLNALSGTITSIQQGMSAYETVSDFTSALNALKGDIATNYVTKPELIDSINTAMQEGAEKLIELLKEKQSETDSVVEQLEEELELYTQYYTTGPQRSKIIQEMNSIQMKNGDRITFPKPFPNNYKVNVYIQPLDGGSIPLIHTYKNATPQGFIFVESGSAGSLSENPDAPNVYNVLATAS